MTPLKHSRNLAARMGRWSAAHRKTAIFGWLAFVLVAFAIGIASPMHVIDRQDAAVGESGRANALIDQGFDLDATGHGEFVLIRSDARTIDDPAFRATIRETIHELSAFPQVRTSTPRRPPATRARSRPTATR